MAAQHGHQDAVKMLINAGANVSAVNKVLQSSFGYCFIEYVVLGFAISRYSLRMNCGVGGSFGGISRQGLALDVATPNKYRRLYLNTRYESSPNGNSRREHYAG